MEKSLDEKRMDRLYKLLRKLEVAHDAETAAALRWALFQLEQHIT